jgi:hypothetical protein
MRSELEFKFDNKFSVYNDPLDLTSFNVEVPKPDAHLDIDVALNEYRRDAANIDFIYSNNAELSVEANWKILLNLRDWAQFWSSRHPNVGERSRAARELRACNASIQRIAEKARACLERRLQA